eukprot:248918_1
MSTCKNSKRDKPKHSSAGGARQTKKGGGGGKGTWGSYKDDLKFEQELDKNDPNYDSQDDTDEVLVAMRAFETAVKGDFHLNLERIKMFKKEVHDAGVEYLRTLDAQDFRSAVTDLQLPQYHSQVVKILMSLSFDKQEKHREHVVSLVRLLLNEGTISSSDLEQSFNILLNRLPDLLLDVPDARSYLTYFVGEFRSVLGETNSVKFEEVLSDAHGFTSPEQAARVNNIFAEFFESEAFDGLDEGVRALSGQGARLYTTLLTRLISLSLDRGGRARELVSRVLARCCAAEAEGGSWATHNDVAASLTSLLDDLDDLHEDLPDVDRQLGYFLARAIVDECLPPSFLDELAVHILEGDVAYPVLTRVRRLLAEANCAARLARIWGPDSHSVKELKSAIHALILEYFSSNDITELHRSLRELSVPHFHHEFVKQVFVICLDRKSREIGLAENLLVMLVKEGLVSREELAKGFDRIQKDLVDIKIDAPHAPTVFNNLRAKVVKCA